jgi:hypothetical protein
MRRAVGDADPIKALSKVRIYAPVVGLVGITPTWSQIVCHAGPCGPACHP